MSKMVKNREAGFFRILEDWEIDLFSCGADTTKPREEVRGQVVATTPPGSESEQNPPEKKE